MPRAASNGVHDNPWQGEDGLWYFSDETESEHGPFPSVSRAAQELRWYILYLDGMLDPETIAVLRSNNVTLRDETHKAMMEDILAPLEEIPAHWLAEEEEPVSPSMRWGIWFEDLCWLLAGMVFAYFVWALLPS